MANSGQDWPADPGSTEHAGTPAASSGEDSFTGDARPSMARSVWADMLISGPDEDAPSWPSSGLPPSFGQRPVAGERPDFGDAGYGAMAPSPPEPDPGGYGVVEPSAPEPGPGGYGVVVPPDVSQARGWGSTEDAFGPWETYETGTSYEPAVGYGVVPAQEPTAGS